MRIKKLIVDKCALEFLEKERNKWVSRGLEDGKYIFGRIYGNGVADLTHILSTKGKRTPVSFSGDHEYANSMLERLRKCNPEITVLGEYHVHPWKGRAALSHGDMLQLAEVKRMIPWYIAVVATADDLRIYDLNGDSHVNEVECQVISSGNIRRERLLDRIREVTRSEKLVKKSVLLVGLGSGGSVILLYLACTGIGKIIIVDNDVLHVENVIRHEGTIEDVGKPKTEICKRIAELHNPYLLVEAHNLDVIKNVEILSELVSQADLIIGASGSPRVNSILNKLSIAMNKPAIYGGVFERAAGSYVLAVKPRETACFNCLFDTASGTVNVDGISDKRAYLPCPGIAADELHSQQGVWIDVSFPALILCKMVLAILEDYPLDYNLVLYDSSLRIRKIKLKRRNECPVCGTGKTADESLRGFSRIMRGLRFWQRI